ncbi:MAG: acyl--CoA ligase [Eubacterium sp.]|nr:acyl--CoA ligase [Eubacterium sp.]
MNNECKTIVEALAYHAEHQPDRLAVADKKHTATYGEFWQMALRGASYLMEQGVRRGDVVVLRGVQKFEYLLGVFSCHVMGAVICPLEKAIRDDRILEIMDFVGASRYVADKPVESEAVCNLSYKDLLAAASDPERVPAQCAFPEPEDLSDILFTTGTTGKSKGIEVTFGCNVAIAENVIDSVSKLPDDMELIATPVSHSLAMRRTYAAVWIGSSLVLTEGFKFANTFFKMMDTYRISAVTLVPAILEQILAANRDKFASYDGQLRYIQFGSAPLSETNKEILLEMFPHVRLYNTYGATESGCTIILEFSKHRNKTGCIGRTTVNTHLLVVDDDRNPIESSENNTGYLAFDGPMNMRGYHREPEITKEAMDDAGIIYTNDIGYIGEDGLVYLIGRKGDVINMGGIKIAPTEIEEVAALHPMVRDCACIPVTDPITGSAPKLFVELEDGYPFDQAELAGFLLQKLEALKVPKVYEVIDKIPRTFNGKIIRKDLKEN